MSTTMEIARTISRQISVMDKMAVGYRNPTSMTKTESRLGGLTFQVNKGRRYVDVELTPSDTYRVKYYRVKVSRTYEIEHITLGEVDDVYWGELGNQIYNLTQKELKSW